MTRRVVNWRTVRFQADVVIQVNSLIICGGMAFTFKKTLENVKVRVVLSVVELL